MLVGVKLTIEIEAHRHKVHRHEGQIAACHGAGLQTVARASAQARRRAARSQGDREPTLRSPSVRDGTLRRASRSQPGFWARSELSARRRIGRTAETWRAVAARSGSGPVSLRCRTIAVRMRSNAADSPRRKHGAERRKIMWAAAASCGACSVRLNAFVSMGKERVRPSTSTTSLPRLYHPSTTSLPSLYHLSTIPLPRLYHPSHVSLEPLTLSRGGSPESFKRKAVGIQTNPTCALYASALPLRNLSTSIAMPYAQQAHSCCHSVTSRPSFSLSQFHRHTAAARGCVSE